MTFPLKIIKLQNTIKDTYNIFEPDFKGTILVQNKQEKKRKNKQEGNLSVVYCTLIQVCKVKPRKASNLLVYLEICRRFYGSRRKQILQSKSYSA